MFSNVSSCNHFGSGNWLPSQYIAIAKYKYTAGNVIIVFDDHTAQVNTQLKFHDHTAQVTTN